MSLFVLFLFLVAGIFLFWELVFFSVRISDWFFLFLFFLVGFLFLIAMSFEFFEVDGVVFLNGLRLSFFLCFLFCVFGALIFGGKKK